MFLSNYPMFQSRLLVSLSFYTLLNRYVSESMNIKLNANISVSLINFNSWIKVYKVILATTFNNHIPMGMITYLVSNTIRVPSTVLNINFSIFYPFILVIDLVPTNRLPPIIGTSSTGTPRPFNPRTAKVAITVNVPINMFLNIFMRFLLY